MVGGDDELRRRGRRAVAGVDVVEIFGARVQHLLAGDGEGGRHHRRAVDHGDAGGVHQAEVADVLAQRAVGIGDKDLRAGGDAAYRGTELAGRIGELRPVEIDLDHTAGDENDDDDHERATHQPPPQV